MAKVKISSSVGNFGEKVQKAWGLELWKGWNDPDKEVVFFGMYHQLDFNCYHHLSDDIKRTIFWCGSDVLRLLNDPERVRILNLFPVEHWCETKEEYDNLKKVGIEAKIGQSFLEDPKDFPLTYKPSKTPHIWLSGHTDREVEYGVDIAYRMAQRFPEYTFHIYGCREGEGLEEVAPKPLKNFINHGIIPNEQFNKEIQGYQMGLRCNEHEGFSEVPIKAILMGQYTATRMKFPMMDNFTNDEELAVILKGLKDKKEPNLEAREYWIKKLNPFPWVNKNVAK